MNKVCLPVPKVKGLRTIDGKIGIVFECIKGESKAKLLGYSHLDVGYFAEKMAQLQMGHSPKDMPNLLKTKRRPSQ